MKKKGNEVEGLVYVESVAEITGGGFMGENRYMGIVESQEIKAVEKDSDKKVKEIFVEVEQVVNEGDPLFEYDTDEMTLKLRQLELELTSIYNGINTMNEQISGLVTEREEAPADSKLQYTAQIQNLQAQINQSNYDASAKQLEIDRQTAAIANSIVYSPMDGIIKEINDDSNPNSNGSESYDPYGGSSTPSGFISIMAKGDYRIKATANEMNVRSMMEGQPMIIRSRIDESVTWTGMISKIDLEHPDNQNNDYYYYGEGESATKYPFYIEIEEIGDLMLGQHVYVELDYGQGEVKDGIWLDEYYLLTESDGTYLWVENKDGYIEKRKVELGEYDEELFRYEILSGITKEDYIAYPEPRIVEGMKTSHNYEEVILENGSNMDMFEDGMFEDGMYEDGMYEDGMSEDGMYEDGMYEDGMSEDGMYEDGMYEDGMYEDGMSEDGMFEDGMFEDESMEDDSFPDADAREDFKNNAVIKEDDNAATDEETE